MTPHHLKELRALCHELQSVLENATPRRRREPAKRDAERWSRRLLALRCLQARRLITDDEITPILSMVSFLRRVEAVSEIESARLDEVVEDVFALQANRLPSIFDDSTTFAPQPVSILRCLELIWAPELDALFSQVDTLSWAHQMWNEEKRQQLFKKVLGKASEKIGPPDLVIATQLYTPQAIARFLVQNSLGALWASSHGQTSATGRWEYFVEDADGAPHPKSELSKITLIDPSCGAGNLLLESFDLFYDLYHQTGDVHSEEAICRTIIERNLYGIDLDKDAIDIAQAILWMRAAEKVPSFPAVRANLCCIEVTMNDPASEARAFIDKAPAARSHRAALENLFNTLSRVGVVGSLITVTELDVLKGLSEHPFYERLESYLAERVGSDRVSPLRGLQWLTRRYDVVVANPPFLSNRQMGSALRRYIQTDYQDTAEDLYACFVRRLEQLTAKGGFYAFVSPQGWTTLQSFATLRKRWLKQNCLRCFVALGQRTFAEAPLLYVSLTAAQRTPPTSDFEISAIRLDGRERQGIWSRLQTSCQGATHDKLRQRLLLKIPSTPIAPFVPTKLLELLARSPVLIGDRAEVVAGIDTGENVRCVRYRWEVSKVQSNRFRRYSKGKGYQRWAAPNPWVVDWGLEGERVRFLRGSTIRNVRHHFREGLEYSYVYGGKVSCRRLRPSILDHGSAGIFTSSIDDSLLIFALLNSRLGTYIGRTLSPTLNLSVGCVKRFPFPSQATTTQREEIIEIARACYALKSFSLERSSPHGDGGLVSSIPPPQPSADEATECSLEVEAAAAVLLVLEARVEETFAILFGLDADDLGVVYSETGAPPASSLSIEGMGEPPPRPLEIEGELSAAWSLAIRHAVTREISDLPAETVDTTRRRMEELYEDAMTRSRPRRVPQGDDHGSRPLPSESFVELASSTFGLHPFTTYWLLHEGILRRRWGADRTIQNSMLDWAHDSVLHHLDECLPLADDLNAGFGYLVVARWPRNQSVFTQLLGGGERFNEVVGTSLPSWIETSFFRTHIGRSAKRPVAWQLQSSPTKKGVLPAFICFIDGRVVSAETLPRLRDRVISPLRNQLNDLACRSQRQDQELIAALDEIIDFETRLTEIISDGFGCEALIASLREESIDEYCSSDGSAPPPSDVEAFVRQESAYDPDPADGVRVNIAPLQRAGVLSAPVLSLIDTEKAIEDRARYRAEERCWCRERLFTMPGWWSD